MANGRSTSGLSTRTNAQIANAIRNEATPAYQAHVPPATQANIERVLASLNSAGSKRFRNEFESAFLNKIVMTEINYSSFTNPLAKFKKGSMPYGGSMEEIQVGFLQAKAHSDALDSDDNEVWKKELPPIDIAYHTENRYDKYKVTIPEKALNSAFLNEGGLASFASALIESLRNSDERDEYLIMRELFSIYDEMGGWFKVNVPDLRTIESSQDDARRVLRTMRAWAGKLAFISENYNAARMPMSATADELELFITPEANAALDVDALASFFNVDRGEFATRTTMVDELPGNAIAILTTNRFFQVYDQIYETASIQNPANLTVNHWLHHKQIVSFSRFVPAIVFTTDPGTDIDAIDIATATLSPLTVSTLDGEPVESVERGARYQVDSYGLPANAEIRTATELALTGGDGERTFVTQKGVLEVDIAESAATLTLRHTALDDRTKTATVTLPVTGEIVRLWPNPDILDEPGQPGEPDAN